MIFDPATVKPGPVHTRRDLPGGAARLYAEAEGIAHVLVDGVEIVRNGELTAARPGTALRRRREHREGVTSGATSRVDCSATTRRIDGFAERSVPPPGGDYEFFGPARRTRLDATVTTAYVAFASRTHVVGLDERRQLPGLTIAA